MGIFGGGKSKHNHWDRSKPCIACLEEKSRGASFALSGAVSSPSLVPSGTQECAGCGEQYSSDTAAEHTECNVSSNYDLMSAAYMGMQSVSVPEPPVSLSERAFAEIESRTQRLLEEAAAGKFVEGSPYSVEEKNRVIRRDSEGRILVTGSSGTYYADELCRRDPVAAAQAVSVSAHAGQRDKLGVPYPEHPQGVHDFLVASKEYAELTDEEKQDAECAAYLHDVVEDTEVTLEDLRRIGFSEGVISAVDALSTREGEDKDAYYARILASGAVPRALKLADLSHNNLPCRRALLPGAPGVPLKADDPKGGNMFVRLGVKYAKAYKALGAEVPEHLKPFAK